MLGLILYLIPSALSLGYVYLTHNMILSWKFPSEDTIRFDYRVPHEVILSQDWTSVGFVIDAEKKTEDHGYLLLKEVFVRDAYRDPSTSIVYDIKVNGTNDFLENDNHFDGNKITYSWIRHFNTGDSYDAVLAKDGEFTLIYTTGLFDENGNQVSDSEYEGTIQIVLSEDFHDETLKGTFLQIN